MIKYIYIKSNILRHWYASGFELLGVFTDHVIVVRFTTWQLRIMNVLLRMSYVLLKIVGVLLRHWFLQGSNRGLKVGLLFFLFRDILIILLEIRYGYRSGFEVLHDWFFITFVKFLFIDALLRSYTLAVTLLHLR